MRNWYIRVTSLLFSFFLMLIISSTLPTPISAAPIPDNPTTITLTKTSETTATATWTEPSGVYYYYVMISTSPVFSAWGGGLGGFAPRSSQNFTGLTPGQVYYAFVSSVNSSWEWNLPAVSNAINAGYLITNLPPTLEIALTSD